MFNHAPPDYICPICLGVQHIANDGTLLKPSDLVYQDQTVSVFVNSFWVGQNKGHVIVVPNEHYENIYDLPDNVGTSLWQVTQKMARALKDVYGCDGVTLRQNNEPASEQHAWHFHLHIFPRYVDDNFNQAALTQKQLAPPVDRQQYADRLRIYLAADKPLI